VTVLHPDVRIAGISVETLSIKLGGEFPLPRISGTVAKRDNVQPPASPCAAP
jgi:hypothetical protein